MSVNGLSAFLTCMGFKLFVSQCWTKCRVELCECQCMGGGGGIRIYITYGFQIHSGIFQNFILSTSMLESPDENTLSDSFSYT